MKNRSELEFETATLKLDTVVFFAKNRRSCDQCRFCVEAEPYSLKRVKCIFTNEIMKDPEWYIGRDCPLEFKEDKFNGN